jgi:tRNA pseudouridine38-40 synthase
VIFHYKLIIQYKGTHYLGWQIQPEGSGKTVQGELNKTLKIIAKSEEVRSLGAGRTDAGVHALGQVAKVSLPIELRAEILLKAINGNLPEDIRVIRAEVSDEKFFPTVDATSKEYQYRFTMMKSASAFQNDLIYNHPYELDLDVMRRACQILVGEHDFLNYFCEGTDVSSTVRTIYSCEILEVPQDGFFMLPEHYSLKINGSGFLKQMVRLIMGVIWNVGRGKVSLEQFKKSLSPPSIKHLGAVAPPQGLYMVRVNY